MIRRKVTTQKKELDGIGLIKLQEYCLPWVVLRQGSKTLKEGREVSGERGPSSAPPGSGVLR